MPRKPRPRVDFDRFGESQVFTTSRYPAPVFYRGTPNDGYVLAYASDGSPTGDGEYQRFTTVAECQAFAERGGFEGERLDQSGRFEIRTAFGGWRVDADNEQQVEAFAIAANRHYETLGRPPHAGVVIDRVTSAGTPAFDLRTLDVEAIDALAQQAATTLLAGA
jgi:hypothetical protein